MLIFTILNLLVGMVLGQRFKVLALLPASAISLALAIGGAIASAQTPWLIALAGAGALASLQIGYLLGLAVRQLTVIARASRMRGAQVRSSVPVRRPAH